MANGRMFQNHVNRFLCKVRLPAGRKSDKSPFLLCFLTFVSYRLLEKKLGSKYTCEEILDTLKAMNFAKIQEQGFIPLYKQEKITDDLYDICGLRTDYQFMIKSQMKIIHKK